MLGLGPSELVVILLLVVLIFGATKIPQLGRGLGEGISNFKRGLREGNDASAEPPPPPPSGKSA
ncbi:MAG: twin-arginine translocase TatA/TatE family subunit [Deltaproteobacteria bacterium]|jgi:sec-independent protein translocase protein TatA|nr:twin-arginine translocase TatA/TatE family subunit [Deltaproteobacteria bacterium]MBK8696805.1 twin-arginine translocase TatA/TatE family subunit [Deltaproteobacteria bacterium]MBP6832242.1 twin-arginine translocase TatA/TatE family subunit [Deltaproteobacteria bacterium]